VAVFLFEYVQYHPARLGYSNMFVDLSIVEEKKDTMGYFVVCV
jgi:hypothetical protein